MSAPSPTPPEARLRGPAAVATFVVVLVTVALLLSRLKGDFVRPDWFWTFRALFYFQQALFLSLGYLLLAACGGLVRSWRVPQPVSFAGYFLLFLAIVWYAVWAFIRGSFGLEVTWSMLASVFLERDGLRQSGIAPAVLLPLIGLVLGAIAVLTRWALRTARAAAPADTWRTLAFVAAAFVVIHVPVRAWFTYHLNRFQYAVMALDDYVPFAPRIERAIPGALVPRPVLRNVESSAATQAYIDGLATLPMPPVPKKLDIVWISVESLRFDALAAETAPHLWARRDDFQLRLGQSHWSGGNATQFGIFSQLFGVGAYHLERFMKSGVQLPLWRLLQASGYHVRVAKKHYFEFRHLYRFAPPGTEFFDAETDPDALDLSDRSMIDGWLAQRAQRKSGEPQLDFITFDATHWPYYFPAAAAPFQPVGEVSGGVHFVRTPEALEGVHNRYRNAVHFVDSEIDRVMDRLRADGALDHTIVIVTGDHGEEFQERGQITHTGALNDYQARVPLWIHLPGDPAPRPAPAGPTVHIDLVATVLDALGYPDDVLHTQGRSLLAPAAPRRVLMLGEQGNYFPLYHSLVGPTYITRWWHAADQLTFSGVERRDGKPVVGDGWRDDLERDYSAAAGMYLVLPDTAAAPQAFRAAPTAIASPAVPTPEMATP